MVVTDILLTGLQFPESTRWHRGRVWIADWGALEVIAIDASGAHETVARVPSAPCSFDWSPEGALLAVAGGDAAVLRQDPDGSLRPYADLSGITDKPWNEIVVDGRGNAYVNSIGFEFTGAETPGEGGAPGVVALVTPDGTVRQAAGDLSFPNGMVVTPDNATLIVAESWANRLTAFDVAADGRLSNRRVWADVDGYPDGICLDAEGAVWYADVPNKRCVRVRAGGDVLDIVAFDRGCFACTLGGPDRRTLFVAANDWGDPEAMDESKGRGCVLAAPAPAPGVGWPSG